MTSPIYDVAGEDTPGVPLVFLHAAVGDRRMWRPQWEHFAASNPILRIDQRGFGSNPPSATPFNRAVDVVEVIEEVGIERAVLVGGSMGGRIALEVALRRPELVVGLVLLGSAVPGHQWSEQVQQVWHQEAAALDAGDLDAAVDINLRFWLDGPGRDRAAISDVDRRLVADMQRTALHYELAHPDAAPEMPLADLGDRLHEIAATARVAYGDQDANDVEVIARKLAATLPHATLHTIEDAAHLPSFEQPGQVNELIEGLLIELDSPASAG